MPQDYLLIINANDNIPRQWQYNAFGRVTTEIDKLARHIHYHYNAQGALISIENANGGRYLLNRDAEDRLVGRNTS